MLRRRKLRSLVLEREAKEVFARTDESGHAMRRNQR
jgi:hypothetical protein